MTPPEYIRAFERYYRKLGHESNKKRSTDVALAWVVLIQNNWAILTILQQKKINKNILYKACVAMEDNITSILNNGVIDEALLLMLMDLVVSLRTYCKKEKKKRKENG